MGRRPTPALLLGIVLGCGATHADDWPMIRHDAGHGGRSSEAIRGPYRVAWARAFDGEVVATAAEPIVSGGRVYVGTEAGHLWALDARTGATLWRADGDGPILHSPAFADGTVYFGTAGRHVSAIDAADGRLRWRFRSGPGGFGTAPVVAGGRVLIGGRDGRFYALDAADGRLAWTVETDGPIRTTGAVAGERVLFASDDMHAYAADLRSGRTLWKSDKFQGQSLRDVYPVVLDDVAVFRTNPAVSMPERIAVDREALIRAAGVEAPDWKALDRWLKGPGHRGTPEQFEAEQAAILDHLNRDPAARTFYALDVATGSEDRRLPVLWAAGCQGVGIPPVQTSRGPLVFWRTMYSNWNHGVAPLVGLGFLDLGRGRVRPIFHEHGGQPPWNTFWGTADETQNFSAAGDTVIIAHQSTLSAFDLATRRLEPIAGTRDSWGGYPSVPGVRNEWNGPARGAAAIADGWLYWLTGSRLIAVQTGSSATSAKPPAPESVSARPHPPVAREVPSRDELRRRLAEQVAAYLDGAPGRRCTSIPGSAAGSSFSITRPTSSAPCRWPMPTCQRPSAIASRGTWPNSGGRPRRIRAGTYSLDSGRRRELFEVPTTRLRRSGRPPGPSLGWLDAVALYAEFVAGWGIVEQPGVWEGIRAVSGAVDLDRISPAERNRTLAGLLALKELGSRTGHAEIAEEAVRRADQLRARIVEEFRRGAGSLTAEPIAGVARVDELIGRGDAVWTRLGGHKSKVTLFLGLTPRAAEVLGPEVSVPARTYLDLIDRTMPTWYLAWGERPIHYGENFVDYPDNVLGIFAAHALLADPDRRSAVAADVDIPWCAGDLFFIEKLALALGRP